MNLLFRLIWLMLTVRKSAQVVWEKSTVVRMRTHLNDLDANFHMNNGRYLTLMDLGRLAYMLEKGIFWKVLLGGIMPVIGGVRIRYLRSLELWQGFELETIFLGYDEKRFFMKQFFWANNKKGERKLFAEAYISSVFVSKGKVVAPQEIISKFVPSYTKTELSGQDAAMVKDL